MVIYADVLVAINYFVSYVLLCATQRISGIPLARRPKVLAALVGGLCAMAVFLPLQGFVYGVVLRVVTAGAMVAAAWPGRCMADYFRLSIILLMVSFLFAGGVMAICLLWPSVPVSCPGGMVYFEVSPLLLLVSVTLCYLLLGQIKKLYGRGRTQHQVYRMTVGYRGCEVTFDALKDSGNRLAEPFSGLPVAVCTLQVASPLLSEHERSAITAFDEEKLLSMGFRLIAYRAVGGGGMLAAFRPVKLCLASGGCSYDCSGWVAVDPNPMGEWGGVFNPDMLELRI